MNVDFVHRKSDLVGNQIKEWIKEQFSEDDEEEKDLHPHAHLEKQRTFNSRIIDWFKEYELFGASKANDLNLETWNKMLENEFFMEFAAPPSWIVNPFSKDRREWIFEIANEGLALWNSLDINECNLKDENDAVMEQIDSMHVSMDAEFEDNEF